MTESLRTIPGLSAIASGSGVACAESYRDAVLHFVRDRRFHLDIIEQSLEGPDAIEASAASLVEFLATMGVAYASVEAVAEPPRSAAAQ